jgi:hypothetical protein
MKRMLRTILAPVAMILLFAAPPASACGACAEDKVAATYDHAVVVRAAARHQAMVFASVEGGGDPRRVAARIRGAATRTAGVDRASVRVSAEPAAVSFALDPAVAAPEKAVADIAKAAPGVRLEVLRVTR